MVTKNQPDALTALDEKLTKRESQHLGRVLDWLIEADRYVAQNYAALLAGYPEQWIAVRGQRVLGSSRSREQLVRELRRAGKNPAELKIALVTRRKHRLIL
jgi:hypothetical protein